MHRISRLCIGLCLCLLVAASIGTHSKAQEGAIEEPLRFDGVVEPARRALVSNQMDGMVKRLTFAGGEHVAAGQVLVELDAGAFRIGLNAARASVDRARAQLGLAERAAGRQSKLVARGVASEARGEDSAAALSVARASLAEAEAELAQAELQLKRTRILAPITGRIGRPKVAEGAFVEAESKAPLAEIIQIDPILVAYKVPYTTRILAMRETGSERLDDLFEKIDVRIVLPTDEQYPHVGQAVFASPEIDPKTDLLTVWARFANPDGILIPGLKVRVRSFIRKADAQPGGQATESRSRDQ